MLTITDFSVSFGLHRGLAGVSFTVARGEIVVMLGANGAGESSLLRAIGGICEGKASGRIELREQEIL